MRRLTLTPQSWLRFAVGVWFAVLLVISVRVLLQPNRQTVYPIFVQAGRDWLAGDGLYGKVNAGVDQFRYSPLVAATFAPMSVLSDRIGNLVWRWLNAFALLAALAWWARVAWAPRDFKRASLALGWLLVLVLPLALGSLNNGQSNGLVLALILASLAGSLERRWGLVSVCLAVACLFKVYPIAVGLLLVVVYPRPLGTRLAVALVLGMALPFALQRPEYVCEQYLAWFRHIGGDDRQTWPVELTYRDLRLLCRVWWTPLGARTYQLIQCAIAAAIAALCFLQRKALRQSPAIAPDEKELLLTLFALASCWMTAFGAATESSTYILLAPALAAVLVQTRQEGRPRWERVVLAGCYGLLLAAQVSNWFPFGRRFHTFGPQPAAGLVFFSYMLWRAVAVHGASFRGRDFLYLRVAAASTGSGCHASISRHGQS